MGRLLDAVCVRTAFLSENEGCGGKTPSSDPGTFRQETGPRGQASEVAVRQEL